MRFLILLLFFASGVSAQPLAVTNTFSNNSVADAADINQNFTDIVNGVNAKLKTDRGSPYNTAVGFESRSPTPPQALLFNTNYNRQWRQCALQQHREGVLDSNTTGSPVATLRSPTTPTGDYNTASGYKALYSNTKTPRAITTTGASGYQCNSTGV